MDWLDKKIIRRLMTNCRESYHSIARALNVTCPTISYRVNRLRQMGVIQRFIAEISHETLGVEWVMSELRLNRDVDRFSLLKAFDTNACIGDVLALDGGRYLVFAEVYPEEKQDYISCLKSIDAIDYIEVSDIHPVSTADAAGKCKYTTRGERVYLSATELCILRYLTRNARTPIKTISECSGHSPKLIRRLIRKFNHCDGIHLTLRLDLSQCGRVSFLLRTRLRDMRADIQDITDWVTSRYPLEHWFTLFAPRTDSLIHYMTVQSPSVIEGMLREMIQHPHVEDVEACIIYNTFRTEGRTQYFLNQSAEWPSEEEWEVPITLEPETVSRFKKLNI